jgi:hypothetical protein
MTPLVPKQLDLELICDGIGNLAFKPTMELSATTKALECLVFIFDDFVVDKIPHQPILVYAKIHSCIVIEIHFHSSP